MILSLLKVLFFFIEVFPFTLKAKNKIIKAFSTYTPFENWFWEELPDEFSALDVLRY